MKKNKNSISKSNSYETMGDFWDSHNLTDFAGQIMKVHFDVDIKSEKIYCSLDKKSGKTRTIKSTKKPN